MNTKTRLFLLAAMAGASLSSAQITLTAADFPAAGSVFTSIAIDSASLVSLNLGTPGANKTWNFGSIQGDESQEYTSYYAPAAGTTYASSFPGATLAYSGSNDFTSPDADLSYLAVSSSEALSLGSANSEGISAFIDPLKVAEFPMAYNDAFSDIAVGEFQLDESTVDTIEISMEGSADAWGTITTPLGSFQALRVKNVQEFEIEFLGFPVKTTTTGYSWYTKQYKSPVMVYQLTEIDFFGEVETTVYGEYLLDAETASKTLKDLTPMSISPNPVDDRAALVFELSEGGRFQILVSDMTGKVLQSSTENLSAGSQQIQLSLGALAPGTYNVQLIQGNKLAGVERLIKQ